MVASGIPTTTRRRTAAIVLAAVSCFGAAAIAEPLKAQAAPLVQGEAPVAGYYVVQADDYLSGIAATLGVKLADLLKANDLTLTSSVYPGTKLAIPGSTPLPTYTVKAGDFLNGIAKAAGIRLRDLLALNGLQKESLVLPGDVLRLPRTVKLPITPLSTPAAPAPPAAPATPAAPASGNSGATPAVGPLTYTVKNGDYLIGIAIMHSIKVRELIAVNDLQLDSLVYEGLVLKLPATAKAPTPSPTPGALKSPAPAPAPAPKPAPAPAPAPVASADVQKVIDFLMGQQGKPYKFFTAGPDTYDCSGLSKAAYAQVGVTLPHYSGAQALLGAAVDWTTQPILPGDLVFTASSSKPGVISHLGIAIDGSRWIQAPKAGDVVRVGPLPSAVKILAVRRLLPAS